MGAIQEFFTLIDNEGRPYFSFNPAFIRSDEIRPLNASKVGLNYCTFLSDSLQLGRAATGRYSTDLTTRDDIIIAVLSVLLILVIEGILTTILLRTRRGDVDSFGFSVKYFIELARGLESSFLLRRKQRSKPFKRRTLDFKLLLVASSILLLTFGLEIAVLFLSTPQLRDVSNMQESLQLREIEIPDWNEIKDNIDSAINRPCSAITLTIPGIEQGRTQISACVSIVGMDLISTIETSLDSLELSGDEVDVSISSYVHAFGSEHNITIGDLKATYIVRAYFTLDDEAIRIMAKRRFMFKFEKRVEMLHKQYIAFLFSEYSRRGKDGERVNIESLRRLNFSFSSGYGPVVNIVQLQNRQRFRQVVSVVHTTRVKGIIPSGVASLLYAQAVFKAGFGLGLAGPDRYDLILGTGQTPPQPAVVWRETGRTLNWLSLTIILGVASAILLGLRFILEPAGTAEIALFYACGANGSTDDSVLSGDLDENYFSLPNVSDLSTTDGSIDGISSPLSEYSDSERP